MRGQSACPSKSTSSSIRTVHVLVRMDCFDKQRQRVHKDRTRTGTCFDKQQQASSMSTRTGPACTCSDKQSTWTRARTSFNKHRQTVPSPKDSPLDEVLQQAATNSPRGRDRGPPCGCFDKHVLSPGHGQGRGHGPVATSIDKQSTSTGQSAGQAAATSITLLQQPVPKDRTVDLGRGPAATRSDKHVLKDRTVDHGRTTDKDLLRQGGRCFNKHMSPGSIGRTPSPPTSTQVHPGPPWSWTWTFVHKLLDTGTCPC